MNKEDERKKFLDIQKEIFLRLVRRDTYNYSSFGTNNEKILDLFSSIFSKEEIHSIVFNFFYNLDFYYYASFLRGIARETEFQLSLEEYKKIINKRRYISGNMKNFLIGSLFVTNEEFVENPELSQFLFTLRKRNPDLSRDENKLIRKIMFPKNSLQKREPESIGSWRMRTDDLSADRILNNKYSFDWISIAKRQDEKKYKLRKELLEDANFIAEVCKFCEEFLILFDFSVISKKTMKEIVKKLAKIERESLIAVLFSNIPNEFINIFKDKVNKKELLEKFRYSYAFQSNFGLALNSVTEEDKKKIFEIVVLRIFNADQKEREEMQKKVKKATMTESSNFSKVRSLYSIFNDVLKELIEEAKKLLEEKKDS